MFELSEVVGRYAAEDVEELHEAAIGVEIVEMRRGIDRLEAQIARRIAVFKRRGGHKADGSLSLVAWLRLPLPSSPSASASRRQPWPSRWPGTGDRRRLCQR